MYLNDSDLSDECNCQGPGMGCFICNPPPSSAEMIKASDAFIRDIHQPSFRKIMKEEEPQIIKVKWIQRTTDKATLVRTKKEWFWIPLTHIDSVKRTNKGWKFKVKSYFKKTPITVDIHHYFERKEYES